MIQYTKCSSGIAARAFGDAIGEHPGQPSAVNGQQGHKPGLVSPPASSRYWLVMSLNKSRIVLRPS